MNRLEPDEARLVRLAVGVLRARWVVPILTRLCTEPTQFNQLHRELKISSKVLTEALRAMERDGLVMRTPPGQPGKTGSYALTPLGSELQPALRALAEWARAHEQAVEQSRARFDEAGTDRARGRRSGARQGAKSPGVAP